MKDTGVVRRIDELGRVVIPKEIRRAMRMREGETVEVFVSGEDEVVLKRYSSLKSMRRMFSAYGNILARKVGRSVIVTDREEVVDGPSAYVGKKLSEELCGILEKRAPKSTSLSVIKGSLEEKVFVVPLIARGDTVGGIVVRVSSELSEDDRRLVETVGECMALGLE